MFGYSATIGIRVSGQGNLTFAQLTAAVILLGRPRSCGDGPGRRTVLLVIAMLLVTLLVMAAPPWGGDFGAALAGAPGFALLAWLLLGRRVRARTLLLLGVILVASGLLVGIVDMLRPSSQQTHVGRFFNRVSEDGFGGFFLVIRRKAMENFGSFTTTRLVWLIPIGLAFLALPLVDALGTRPRARRTRRRSSRTRSSPSRSPRSSGTRSTTRGSRSRR